MGANRTSILERYLAGALDASAKAQVDAALGESEDDRARLADLRDDTQAFLIAHPPGPLVARFEAERGRQRWRRLILPAALIPIAAAAAALLMVRREPEFEAKGSVVLVIHKRQGEGSVRVEPGATLAPGDQIRFEVRAKRPGYVAVIGRDERDQITIYFPPRGSAPAPYDPSAPLLPGAVALDEETGEEIVYALFGTEPFDLRGVVELGPSMGVTRALPRGVVTAEVEFEKK